MSEIEILKGKTLTEITGKAGDDELLFTDSEGIKYRMWHDQDCCESVYLESITGELVDLIGNPILQAEESTSTDLLDGKPENPDSFTWTFYKLATKKGYVTLRWLGESNGYYSEGVSFEVLNKLSEVGGVNGQAINTPTPESLIKQKRPTVK